MLSSYLYFGLKIWLKIQFGEKFEWNIFQQIKPAHVSTNKTN